MADVRALEAEAPLADRGDDGDGSAGQLVMVVDDEPLVRETLTAGLESVGYLAVGVGSAEAMLTLLDARDFDLLLLDVKLPGISGFDACREVRRRGDTPIIFITAASSLEERLAGFDLGADDYLVKPLSLDELVRRTRAVLRRVRSPARLPRSLLGPCGMEMIISTHEVVVDGRPVDLTALQFDVLEELLQHRGEVRSAEEISLAVWGHRTGGSPNFVEGQVSRVRIALRAAGADNVIERVRGVGWVIR